MMELHVLNRKTGSLLRAFALGDASEVLVGRDESCDVRIRARTVSREHCAIERTGEEFVLRDLGSTAGTYIEGKRVDRVKLRDGMEIEIGPALLKFYETEL
jgi:adenylate cyclase